MEKTVRAIIIDDNKLAVANLKERLNANSLINVVATFSNGSDALDFIVNNGYSFDLILMDIILPKLDGIELLEEMKSRNISKKVIILSSYKDESVIRQCSNYSITHYMLKPYSYMSLEKRIIEAVNFKEASPRVNKGPNLDLEISQLLHNLGIPSHIRGFKYIREGIMIIYNNETTAHVTKEIYPQIAMKYETTPTRVERAIRHAIEVCCSRGDYELMDELFGYSISCDKAKPTNAEFLSTIADRLKIEQKI